MAGPHPAGGDKAGLFSILVDKSTDISDTKLMCVLVKYFCSILIHKLFENSRKLIHQIGRNFIKIDVLKNIESLDVDNVENIQNIENIYTGPECENCLESLEVESARQIRINWLNYYITAVREMLIQLAFEWRISPSFFNDYGKKELIALSLDKMWKHNLDFINFDVEQMFSNLKSLVEIILSLSHSNVEAERIFSIVTDVKNKKRNQLSNDMVSLICVVRSSFQTKTINCTNFEAGSRHFELHNTQNLYDDKWTSNSF
nr:PREDICTED: uncharacterized protein LOC105663900 [Megachile rotundata]